MLLNRNRRVVLSSREVNEDAGVFIIVDTHLAIIFVIVLMFEKCDPLGVGSKPTIEYDVLGNRNGTDVCFVLSKTFCYNRDLVFRNKRAQWNLNWV